MIKKVNLFAVITITNMSSHLKLYIGCMYSGKSTSLLNEISKLRIIEDDILVVNSLLDKKRHKDLLCSEREFIKTHDGKICDAVMVDSLNELYTKYKDLYDKSKIVVIDEAQFYNDLYDFIELELNKSNKLFIVGGLSGDYSMKPIGDVIKLVPLADEIIKLNAYCVLCKNGTIASFTKRTLASNEQIVVGKEDMYIPVCRFHHISSFS